jgi:flagellar motor switch protein FliN/FliY
MNATPNPSALGVLLEIELPMTLSFGKARLRLEDVLGLETESLVELDRVLSDPVDVLVNGRLVARGQVVEVEGNYGVRISEIVSRKERLNTTGETV